MNRAVAVELLHLAAGLALTLAIFRAARWAYPQGSESIDLVGWGTLAAVLAMSVPELVKARAKTRD